MLLSAESAMLKNKRVYKEICDFRIIIDIFGLLKKYVYIAENSKIPSLWNKEMKQNFIYLQ